MRISKEPEVRRQEMIDIALQLFSEKGYEAVTMKDIARKMNVASGLCYHYFQNKYALYQEALQQYAEKCAGTFIDVFRQRELPLETCIEKLGKAWLEAEREGAFVYEKFFHGVGNEPFHRQLDAAMVQNLLPAVEFYLGALKQRQEIHVTDIGGAARFILNGQLGVANDQTMPLERRFTCLRELIVKTLK